MIKEDAALHRGEPPHILQRPAAARHAITTRCAATRRTRAATRHTRAATRRTRAATDSDHRHQAASTRCITTGNGTAAQAIGC